MNDAIVIIVM